MKNGTGTMQRTAENSQQFDRPKDAHARFSFSASLLTMSKRTREEDKQPDAKKQKTPTIPIARGRFKNRWLTKHSSLLKRSDSAYGLMVSCGVNAETRALV